MNTLQNTLTSELNIAKTTTAQQTHDVFGQKVTDIFQKYRKGIDEITDIYIRNEVRDAMIKVTLIVKEVSTIFSEVKD